MSEAAPQPSAPLFHRHRCIGWWSLVAFLAMGLGLEALHGLKAGFYLDPAQALRRELWRLGHAHGTLLAILNLVIASQSQSLERVLAPARLGLVSHLILTGSALLPAGFFLGGLFASEHDPWIAILLVPLGALSLLTGVAVIARAVSAGPP